MCCQPFRILAVWKGVTVPNETNILSPVTLISAGRSGTSLVQGVFGHHPDFQICGETAALAFRAFHAAETALGFVPGMAGIGPEERVARGVRAMYLAMLPGDAPHWFQKPLGAPFLGRDLNPNRDPEPYFDWYWRALLASFPDGRYMTVLRHPCDVMVSWKAWFRESHEVALEKICRMAQIVMHPASPIATAVVYRRLVEDPEGEVRRVFAALDKPYHADCLKALDIAFVAERGRPFRQPLEQVSERREARFSSRARWGEIDRSLFTEERRAVLDVMWARFGETIDWP